MTTPALERIWTPLVFLLAAGIAWSLFSSAWFFLGGAETDLAPPAPAPGASTSASERVGLDAAAIAALNLFGEASAERAQTDLLDAPETRLQLELHGVFLADASTASAAIVAERNRDGHLYRLGDRLPGNAELVEVYGDRIVLRRAGQLETLKFPDAAPGRPTTTGNSGAAGGAMRAASRPSARRPARAGAPPARPGAPAPVERGAQRNLRASIAEYSERLNIDPTGTLAELGVEPVTPGGEGGYRLGNEIPSSTLAQVGLRPGDVVLSVNGQAVGNIEQDRSGLQAIADAGSARLEIQRGERRFFVTTRIP